MRTQVIDRVPHSDFIKLALIGALGWMLQSHLWEDGEVAGMLVDLPLQELDGLRAKEVRRYLYGGFSCVSLPGFSCCMFKKIALNLMFSKRKYR